MTATVERWEPVMEAVPAPDRTAGQLYGARMAYNFYGGYVRFEDYAVLTARVAATREWLYDYASMLQLAISQPGIDPKSWESANDRLTKVIAHLRSTEFADEGKHEG